MVDAIQSSRLNVLWSTCIEGGARTGDACWRRTARFYDRLNRRSLWSGLRWFPARTANGSAGNAGWSHRTGVGEHLLVGKDKSFGSAVFPATRNTVILCLVRRVPGLSGGTRERTFERRISGAERSVRAVRCGRMTVSVAGESPGGRIMCETQFGGRTSKKKWRRVERNPV